MKALSRAGSVIVILLALSYGSLATTWFDDEQICPIDQHKNTFLVIGSYGSYIYSWPSKYQWLFFPVTDSPTYYICQKCHYAALMWDFEKLPKEKIAAVKKVLEGVRVSKKFKKYQELSVSERIEIMEKIYAVLDKDDDFWESFYRAKGYHLAHEGKPEPAAEARRKSLEYLGKMIKDPKNPSTKLVYYISGAMKHFTNDDKGALEDLEKALTIKYTEDGLKAEQLKNAEDGLNERLNDYIKRIKSDKKPRLTDTDPDYR